MKKVISLLLALIMICSFCACGTKANEEVDVNPGTQNELAEYLDKGFVINGSTADSENGYVAMLVKKIDDYEIDYSEVYKVEIPMTAEEYEEWSAFPWPEEGEKDLALEYILSLDDVKISDISSVVPSEEDLNALVGKTFGELEDMGFYKSGWVQTDDGTSYDFYYDGPIFYGKFTLPEGVKVENIDDYSENDIRALTVGGVEFLGLSFDAVFAM